MGHDDIGHPGAQVNQSGDDAGNRQPGVDLFTHRVDGVKQFGKGPEGIWVGLAGHQHFRGKREYIDGKQREAGRGVHQDKIVIPDNRGQGIFESVLPRFGIHQFHFGAGQIDMGGYQVKPLPLGRKDRLFNRLTAVVHNQVVDRGPLVIRLNAQPSGGIGLWIHVHHQHGLAGQRQGRRQVDHRYCLAHTTLLVSHRDRSGFLFGHNVSPSVSVAALAVQLPQIRL